MIRFYTLTSIALSLLWADELGAISNPVIKDLQSKTGLDSKTAAYVKDMVDKTLARELIAAKSGFFLGVEGGLNRSTQHYTILTDGAQKRINDANFTGELGLTAGYDHLFSNDYGLSLSGYFGKGTDIRSDVNTGYFGNIANSHIATNYSTWRSGFDTNLLYQLNDTVRLSAGLSYRYTRYNSIASQDINKIEVDAYTRSADIISQITDQVVTSTYFTTFCTRGEYVDTTAPTRCEGTGPQASSRGKQSNQSQYSRDLEDSKIQAEKSKKSLQQYIKNYIQANSENMLNPDFGSQVARAALDYKQVLEWQYALQKSVEHDLSATVKYGDDLEIKQGPKYSSGQSTTKIGTKNDQLQTLFNKVYANAKKVYEGSSFYDTIVTLDVVKKTYDFIKERGYNLHQTAANFLPENLMRQACGNYNAATYFNGEKQNDCTFLMQLARQISKGLNERDHFTPQVALNTLERMIPRIKALQEAQLRSYTNVLGVIGRKLRALENLTALRNRLSAQELISPSETLATLRASALAANTPAYIKPTRVAYARVEGESTVRSSSNGTNPLGKADQLNPGKDGKTKAIYIRKADGSIQYYNIDCSQSGTQPCYVPSFLYGYNLTTFGDAATASMLHYLFGNGPLPSLDLQSAPLTLEQSQVAAAASSASNQSTQPEQHAKNLVKDISDKIKPTISTLIAARPKATKMQHPESTHIFSPQVGVSLLNGASEFYANYKFGGLVSATSKTSESLYDSLQRASFIRTSDSNYITLGYRYHF